MKSRDFCYWLQGLFELGKPTTLDQTQVDLIKRHLALVFKHEIDEPDPTGVLQQIHDGPPTRPPLNSPNSFNPSTKIRC